MLSIALDRSYRCSSPLEKSKTDEGKSSSNNKAPAASKKVPLRNLSNIDAAEYEKLDEDQKRIFRERTEMSSTPAAATEPIEERASKLVF